MASSAPNKAQVGRAAAILTTAEVAGSSLDLNNTYASRVAVDFTFTIGSLTNVIVKHYVSMDATTWVPLYTNSTQATETLTASGTRAYQFHSLGGWKFFRSTVTGTGTVTSSSAAFTYRYLQQSSQR